MKIYAPVKDFNGLRNNVRFVKGVGETDDPQVIEWFKNRGYNIEMSQNSYEECVEKSHNSNEECENEPNLDEMTPNELRDWAKANGFGSVIKNTRNKEKLLEIIRG